MACVCWSKNTTSKNIRNIQICDNAIRESVQNKTIKVLHIGGKSNLVDIVTKEDKDISHIISIHDQIISFPFPP